MILGAARVELHVHGSQSLKEKRGVVRSVIRRVRNRFNLGVAEVGGQETWQRATIGLAAVGADAIRVRGVLEQAVRFIDELHLAEVVGEEIELLATPLEDEPGHWEPADEDEEEAS